MTPARRRSVAGLAVAVLILAGCGDATDDGATGGQDLQARVAEIRVLATARQPAFVDAKLAKLRVEVDALVQRGELDPARAAEILAAADAVGAELALITTTTTTPAPTTTVAPPPPAEEEDDDGGGRGNGKKGDDEDD